MTKEYHDVSVFFEQTLDQYRAVESGESDGVGQTPAEALHDFANKLDHERGMEDDDG